MKQQYITTQVKCLSQLSLIIVLFFSSNTLAGRAVRQWQTTKTSSLAGAGIAAPTMIEALYVNPAMYAYFTTSSFYFQNHDGKIDPLNSSRTATFGDSNNPEGFSAAITDGSNPAKGGFTYTDQEESGTERKRYGFGFGNTVDGDSAFGVNYSYIVDEFSEGSIEKKSKLHVGSMGYLSIVNPQFSYAIIWNDPAWADRLNSKTVFGMHYRPFEKLSLMLDLGQDIKRSINKTLYYAAGLEVEVYTDVYARCGVFQDKIFNLKGYGFGLGWIGPRIGLEVAIKQSQRKDEFNTFLLQDEKLKETEASLLYLF